MQEKKGKKKEIKEGRMKEVKSKWVESGQEVEEDG